MSDLLGQAVRNNADWCDRICALHGRPGRLAYAAWSTRSPAPRYYLPTSSPCAPIAATAQMEIIASLDLATGWA